MKFVIQTCVAGALLAASTLTPSQRFPATTPLAQQPSVVSPELQDCFDEDWENPDLDRLSPTFPCQEEPSDLYEFTSTPSGRNL